jgi:hypothetical protein
MLTHHRVLLSLAAFAVIGALLHAEPAAPPRYQFRYHNYADSVAILKDLASRNPTLAKVYSIGRSSAGTRDIWCIEIANQQAGPVGDKPAVYFDGNQHASEVMGGEVTLHLAYYLLTNYKKDPAITQLIDTRVTYIVQRADPDGAEAYMTGKIDWDPAAVPGARDADGDGKKGEDGPEDIDGDGEILQMRVPDPSAQWKPYKDEPRLMVRREKGDREGPFYRVLDEGIDNDGDGQVNEDPPIAGFISNRNYPAFWASTSGRFRGEGDRPLQEQNAVALVDFIISHPQISQVESFHTTSGIHLRPYAARPDTDFPAQDLQDYNAVLAKGTELTGYPVASIYNDFTEIQPNVAPDDQPGIRRGVFVDWAYVYQGLFAVTTELWTLEPFLNEIGGWGAIPRDRPLFAIPGRYNRPDVQASFLKWLDAHSQDPALSGQGFVKWKPFNHPTLGKVELGGFTRYILRNPPPGPYFEKVAVDQAKFAVVQALTTPLVKIREVTVKAEPPEAGTPAAQGATSQWLVTATVVNEGYLDTSTEQARLAQIAKPADVSIELPATCKTADPKRVSFPFLRGKRGSSFESLYTATWHVAAPAGAQVAVTLRSEKGAADRRTVTLAESPGRSVR